MSSDSRHIKGLLNELERLADAGKTHNINTDFDIDNLSTEEQEAVRLLRRVFGNLEAATEYSLMKYTLTSDALGIALWDMDVVEGDPVNPENQFTWSKEFRRMLGFSDEADFPNILSS
ncbi:MAG: hypothetical protein LBH07_07225, partial [Treponema sp.]|nr:hypothetical protein [Treponema sp.]